MTEIINIVKKRDDTYHYEWIEKNGTKNGKYKRWNIKYDILQLECNFKNGLLEGEYKVWHDAEVDTPNPGEPFASLIGKKKFECNFKNGLLDGKYVQYDIDFHTPEVECEFKNGLLDGKYVQYKVKLIYNSTGNTNKRIIVKECDYKKGLKDGNLITYFDYENINSISDKIPYKNGKINGMVTSWYSNREKYLEFNMKDDVISYYYEWYNRKLVIEYNGGEFYKELKGTEYITKKYDKMEFNKFIKEKLDNWYFIELYFDTEKL